MKPSMRVDEKMMLGVLGVVAIGFVAHAFSKPKTEPDAPPPPPPRPPDVPVGSSLPAIPQDVGGRVKAGVTYWGRYDGGEAPDALARALDTLGFEGISIYPTRASAAAAIPMIPHVLDASPAAAAGASGSTTTLWFRATARRPERFQRPSSLTYLWPSSGAAA